MESSTTPAFFSARGDKRAIEEGAAFQPKFDADGLIVCVTSEVHTGDILMVAYMNAESLRLTLETDGRGLFNTRSLSRNLEPLKDWLIEEVPAAILSGEQIPPRPEVELTGIEPVHRTWWRRRP